MGEDMNAETDEIQPFKNEMNVVSFEVYPEDKSNGKHP